MNCVPSAMYLHGFRVPCVRMDLEGPPETLTACADNLAERSSPIALTHMTGPAPDGWITVPRDYARPLPANPEPLTPLCSEHFHAMRGLYGLSAGRFNGMLAREDPAAWDTRLSSLNNPLGLIENERLLLWLDVWEGDLLELSAAPDALGRIPGALSAAGVTRAPAPLLGVPAEETEDSLKLRLVRPFHLSDERIETARQLVRAMDGAVQWD